MSETTAMIDELDRLARETAAKLIPHTTSVHNVSVITEALTRAREMGRAEEKWLPIETAPKDGTWVLGYVLHPAVTRPTIIQFDPDQNEWVSDDILDARKINGLELDIEPTHWMPLPTKPASKPFGETHDNI